MALYYADVVRLDLMISCRHGLLNEDSGEDEHARTISSCVAGVWSGEEAMWQIAL